jgi:hypothetical protein
MSQQFSDVPDLAAYVQLSDIAWQYKTEPQPIACLGFNEKSKISL